MSSKPLPKHLPRRMPNRPRHLTRTQSQTQTESEIRLRTQRGFFFRVHFFTQIGLGAVRTASARRVSLRRGALTLLMMLLLLIIIRTFLLVPSRARFVSF